MAGKEYRHKRNFAIDCTAALISTSNTHFPAAEVILKCLVYRFIIEKCISGTITKWKFTLLHISEV